MLTIVKGPISYIDLRTVENITYPTFRETCEASGSLADDREYVEAIKEDNEWGSGVRFYRGGFTGENNTNEI